MDEDAELIFGALCYAIIIAAAFASLAVIIVSII